MVRREEWLTAYGHEHVTATHRTTFEITKEKHLTLAGSCIIAVGADKSGPDLDSSFLSLLREGPVLTTTLTCDSQRVTIRSKGSGELSLTHPTDLVWRRSTFTCDRTIGICADHTAQHIPREMVRLLQEGAELSVLLVAEL